KCGYGEAGERYGEDSLHSRRRGDGSHALGLHGVSRRLAAVRVVLIVLVAAIGCATRAPSSGVSTAGGVQRTPFGTLPGGRAAEMFTLRNAHGVEVQLTNYGGIITSIRTPDRAGRFADIVLGYDDLAGYLRDSPYFGAI